MAIRGYCDKCRVPLTFNSRLHLVIVVSGSGELQIPEAFMIGLKLDDTAGSVTTHNGNVYLSHNLHTCLHVIVVGRYWLAVSVTVKLDVIRGSDDCVVVWSRDAYHGCHAEYRIGAISREIKFRPHKFIRRIVHCVVLEHFYDGRHNFRNVIVHTHNYSNGMEILMCCDVASTSQSPQITTWTYGSVPGGPQQYGKMVSVAWCWFSNTRHSVVYGHTGSHDCRTEEMRRLRM